MRDGIALPRVTGREDSARHRLAMHANHDPGSRGQARRKTADPAVCFRMRSSFRPPISIFRDRNTAASGQGSIPRTHCPPPRHNYTHSLHGVERRANQTSSRQRTRPRLPAEGASTPWLGGLGFRVRKKPAPGRNQTRGKIGWQKGSFGAYSARHQANGRRLTPGAINSGMRELV